MITITQGEGKHIIKLEILTTEKRGITIFITGGNTPHVGAVALAVPSKNAATGDNTCDLNVITAYGHKDRFLAEKVADMVCRKTGEITSVTAGVHIADAAKEDLKQLSDNTVAAAEAFLSNY